MYLFYSLCMSYHFGKNEVKEYTVIRREIVRKMVLPKMFTKWHIFGTIIKNILKCTNVRKRFVF